MADSKRVGSGASDFTEADVDPDMGDPACYRNYCPDCDAEVTIVDGTCPDCGADLSDDT